MGTSREAIAALEDALTILDAFTTRTRSLSLSRIAAALGADEPRVAALLVVLCRRGYVAHNPATGEYEPGVRGLELGDLYLRQSALVEAARPVLCTVRDEVDETTMLAIRRGDERIDIDQAESRQVLRQVVAPGMRKSLYTGAGGRVLLAGLDARELDAYLDRVTLARLSPTTMVDRGVVKEAIERVRTQGFAESFSERSGGGATIGAPVRGRHGEVLAALVVSTPLYRFSLELRERIIAAVLEGAEQISHRLARDSLRGSGG